MPDRVLDFYFDLHSPYSYLAFHVISTSSIFNSVHVNYIPILLPGLVKTQNITPPWGLPPKVKYIERDVKRWAQEFSTPWTSGWPANYPQKSTLHVQRALIACDLSCSRELYIDLIGALYHAFWVEKVGVQDAEVFGPILVEVLGQDMAEKVMQRAQDDEVKNLLRQNTEGAVKEGVVGLPWFAVVDGKGRRDGFWGFDHLGLVARALGIRGEHLGKAML